MTNHAKEVGYMYARVKDFPEYVVKSDGTIFSNKKNKYKCRRGWKKLKPRKTVSGYLMYMFVDGNRSERGMLHRLVGKYFVDGYFDGAVIDHIDGDITNNDYRNLRWVTQKENVHFSYKHSRYGPMKNYCVYQIILPDGNISENLVSGTAVKRYIIENELDVKASMLLKHRNVNGYKLVKVDKTL